MVEFLNAQMPNIEVLAVEIKRFHREGAQTLVPRVIGRTSALASRVGRRLTRGSFMERFADDSVKGVAARLLDAAVAAGGDVSYGDSGLSVRARCSSWPRPVSVAWLYSEPDKGWMRPRDFSFGASVLNEGGVPESLRAVLESWTSEFSRDRFTRDVSSKGVSAWAVTHDAAVQHQDILVERLHAVLSKLTPL